MRHFIRGISLFIIACPSRPGFIDDIRVRFCVPVGFLHVLYSGDGWGESFGASADWQCLHLQAGQATRALEVCLLHVPARWVSLLIFLLTATPDLYVYCKIYSTLRLFFYSLQFKRRAIMNAYLENNSSLLIFKRNKFVTINITLNLSIET